MEIHAAAMVTDVLETIEVPENGHVGNKASPSKNVEGSIAQLKCTYTNARSRGNGRNWGKTMT